MSWFCFLDKKDKIEWGFYIFVLVEKTDLYKAKKIEWLEICIL